MQRTALVIDDNRQTADSLTRMLGLLDIQSQTVYSARNAMVEADERPPDVVFLDIRMPGVDGFEVLGFLKRDPRMKDVPVIVISSETQQENVRRARAMGAIGFLPKPVGFDSLEQALQHVFS